MSEAEEYERCPLCRISHRKWKRHVYTRKHREVLHNILMKFSKKAVSAKKLLKSPQVHDAHWEVGAKHWCYFCTEEIQKHEIRDEGVAVESAGFIKHLASPEHKEKALTFWKVHRLEKERQKFYLIDPDKLDKWDERINEALERFLTEREMKRKTEAAKIDRIGQQRIRLVEHHRRNYMSQIPVDSSSHRTQQVALEASPLGAVRTVDAKAANLTFVALKNFDKDIGNLHSGSVPPWLRDDTTDSTNRGIIGPTEEDLIKHKVNEKKRKLPPNRVGAKFNHEESTTESWMPSFGRVWSNQRRSHGQQKFIHELSKKTRRASSTVTSYGQSASPYIQKKESDFTPYNPMSDDQPQPVTPEENNRDAAPIERPVEEGGYASTDASAGDFKFSIRDSIAKAVHGNVNVVAEPSLTHETNNIAANKGQEPWGFTSEQGLGDHSDKWFYSGAQTGPSFEKRYLEEDLSSNPMYKNQGMHGQYPKYESSAVSSRTDRLGPDGWQNGDGHIPGSLYNSRPITGNAFSGNTRVNTGYPEHRSSHSDARQNWNYKSQEMDWNKSFGANGSSTGGFSTHSGKQIYSAVSDITVQGQSGSYARPYSREKFGSDRQQNRSENLEQDGQEPKPQRLKIASSLLK